MEFLMALLILSNFILLASSRLSVYIRILAIQGILIGLMLLLEEVFILAIIIIALKGIIFPYFLNRVLRDIRIRREAEPFIGYTFSVILGIFVLAISLWFSSLLPVFKDINSTLFIPTAFFTIMVGFILLITRRKAITQVLGYINLENGIFIFGSGLAIKSPLIVEMGVLLDVFVAVFIMGIIIFQINREFDGIDTFKLTILKE